MEHVDVEKLVGLEAVASSPSSADHLFMILLKVPVRKAEVSPKVRHKCMKTLDAQGGSYKIS